MGVTDCHLHLSPFGQLRPEARHRLAVEEAELDRLARDPSAFLARLDDAGVERAVLINYVAPEVMGYTEAVNEFVAQYARADPDRLIAVGGIRPDRPDAEREIVHLVHDLGLRAIKLHPPHQLFRPNAYVDAVRAGPRAVYAACEREGIPVIFHTGTSVFPGARSRFGDPMLVEDVAIDFPELTIVLAHGGRPIWTETATYLARRFPNVWLELSGVPPAHLLEYFPKLPRFADKALFGSDWPGPGVRSIRTNLEQFRALPIPAETQRRILEENPLRVFPRRTPT